ncbi:hypothetical protein LINGRAPRIM_LOCUS20 [Linum grandiflorum]
MSTQVIEVRKLLEDSRLKVFTGTWVPPYGQLNTDFSLWAIQLLKESQEAEFSCFCVLRETKGLPCRCEVRRLMEAGKLLTKLNLHRFWATLDYTNPPDGAEWENVAVGELAQWESAVDEVASLGESSIRSCARLLQYYLHPEAEDIREPKENAVLKGRPRRRSNARDPSWFEKVTPRKS